MCACVYVREYIHCMRLPVKFNFVVSCTEELVTPRSGMLVNSRLYEPLQRDFPFHMSSFLVPATAISHFSASIVRFSRYIGKENNGISSVDLCRE